MNLKLLSYNIHKGNSWNLTPKIHLIHSQIQDHNSDIVFLQEVPGTQSEQLRSEIHPHLIYGQNTSEDNHHGNAILSKHPVIFSENINISMHRFERRGLLHAIIKLDNQVIHLLCTHLGLFTKDRGKQLDVIAKHIIDNIPANEPVILAGDFNDWPGHATKHIIQDLAFQEAFLSAHKSYAKTFPALIPILKLDRMYYRGFMVDYAQCLTGKLWRHLSDHIAIEVSLNLVV